MIFNSQEFLLFFSFVVPTFFFLPNKFRRYFLLFVSYLFYAWWNPFYIILIIASTLTDFYAGKKIFSTQKKYSKKRWLFFSIFINIGILFTFKYANFFGQILNLTHDGGTLINVLLPVGISFYTFQTLSYTIDIFRNKLKPEKDLAYFALYVAFFPQLVAGPIERAGNIIPQFKKKVKFDTERITKGLFLMIFGFFQKVVIADNLAVFVDVVYNNPNSYQGLSIIIATVFFAFQIYNDFTGYTNIARGAALIFGIKLSVNFRQPYFAHSLQDFWRRWHISLSTWFRDYVYISLGGKKTPFPKWIILIVIVFTVSGLWHGANWTFIVWGLLNGIVFLIESIIRKKNIKVIKKNNLIKFLQIILTFVIINFLWIFFRANSIQDAFLLINNLLTPNFSIPFDKKWLIVNFILIFLIVIIDFISNKKEFHIWLYEKPVLIKGFVIYLLFLMIIFIGNWHLTPFIYFQF